MIFSLIGQFLYSGQNTWFSQIWPVHSRYRQYLNRYEILVYLYRSELQCDIYLLYRPIRYGINYLGLCWNLCLCSWICAIEFFILCLCLSLGLCSWACAFVFLEWIWCWIWVGFIEGDEILWVCDLVFWSMLCLILYFFGLRLHFFFSVLIWFCIS